MSEANRGNRGPSVASYGIMRSMSKDARRTLGDAVKRHRDYLGWSRPEMVRQAAQGIVGPDPISVSTIKNVETGTTELEGKTALAIERVFGWPSNTVADILNGKRQPPEPSLPGTPEPEAMENERAWQMFLSWPEDVQDAALQFGALLNLRPIEVRQPFADRVFGELLRSPI